MNRANNTPATRRRRKRILKQAKGYFGSKHKLFRTAKEQVMNAKVDAFAGRKQRKRDFRRLWITRLNNACSSYELTYSRFIRLLTLAQIKLNRKQLSEMAINEPKSFGALIDKVRNPWQISA
jgi:large subunit ribosomal protein L20